VSTGELIYRLLSSNILFSVYLCDRVRPSHYVNNTMTCHQIWHIKWKNGDEHPRPRVGRDIQMRGLGKKRRRRVQSSRASDDEEDAEEDGAAGSKASEEEEVENAAEESGPNASEMAEAETAQASASEASMQNE
jgi:hypothetical protein